MKLFDFFFLLFFSFSFPFTVLSCLFLLTTSSIDRNLSIHQEQWEIICKPFISRKKKIFYFNSKSWRECLVLSNPFTLEVSFRKSCSSSMVSYQRSSTILFHYPFFHFDTKFWPYPHFIFSSSCLFTPKLFSSKSILPQ